MQSGSKIRCTETDRAGRMEGAGFPADYQDLIAAQKIDALWGSIQASTYPAATALPTEEPSAAAQLRLLWPPYLWATFLHSSDLMPKGRAKLIHTFGSVCKVSLKINTTSRQALSRSLPLLCSARPPELIFQPVGPNYITSLHTCEKYHVTTVCSPASCSSRGKKH